AWAVIDYTRENVVGRVRELTDGAMVPVVYDSLAAATRAPSLDCLQRPGLMVSYRNSSGAGQGGHLRLLNEKGYQVGAAPSLFGYAETRGRAAGVCRALLDVLTSGAVIIKIGQRYALAEAGRAQRRLAGRRTAGSAILTP